MAPPAGFEPATFRLEGGWFVRGFGRIASPGESRYGRMALGGISAELNTLRPGAVPIADPSRSGATDSEATVDQAVRKPRTSWIEYQMGRKVKYEIPDLNGHTDHGLRDYDRGVEVYHTDHVAKIAIPQWINPTGHYVYIVWGADDEDAEALEVLYVGLTSKLFYRIAQHSTDSMWWFEAHHIDVYQYATRVAAAEVEQFCINQFGPLYNRNYNNGVAGKRHLPIG